MVLVGLADNAHDSNLSVWKDGKFRYAKYERESGKKHARAPANWFWNTLNSWYIEEKDVKAFAYVEPHKYYRRNKSNTWLAFHPAPFFGEHYLTKEHVPHGWNGIFSHLKNKHYYLLDHHYCHFFSNTTSQASDNAIISDTGGSNNHKTLILGTNSSPIRHTDIVSSGRLLFLLGDKMGIKGDETDVIGKIMGLQAYGEADETLVDKWVLRGRFGADKLYEWIKNLEINASVENPAWLNIITSVFEIGYHYQKQLFETLNKDKKIFYSGGIALNVNWNRKILDQGFKLSIEPHVYDGGLSLGCLRFLGHKYGIDIKISDFPYVQDDQAPLKEPTQNTLKTVSNLLAENKIVGWYQGHGEIGPRALGNRSILMNPALKNGKDLINKKVKGREWWRPFGASVKEDKSSTYFDLAYSPYMLYTSKVLTDQLPSITHKDGTCRHQTVSSVQNKIFYDLLDKFEAQTGLPLLLNTSLNTSGNPICGTFEQALTVLKQTQLDALCIGNQVFKK